MPKITRGGVSNRLVDPDFIAEPGTPVEKALDEDLPNVNGTEDEDAEGQKRDTPDRDLNRDREADDEQPKGNDDAETGRNRVKPANETPAFDPPKKSTPAKKK